MSLQEPETLSSFYRKTASSTTDIKVKLVLISHPQQRHKEQH